MFVRIDGMGMCSTVYRPQVHLIAAKDAIKKAMTVYDNVVCPLSSSLPHQFGQCH
jgi:hypothetical protein